MRVELVGAEPGGERIVVVEPPSGGAARREREFPAGGAGCAAALALVAARAIRGPEAGEDDSDEELEVYAILCVNVMLCLGARLRCRWCMRTQAIVHR